MGEQSNNDYLTTYRKFFERFESSVDPKDQLPVKVAGYNVAEFEIPGEVADWAMQYLNERKCPPNLIAPIIRIVLDEINQKCKAQPTDCGYRPQKDDYQSLKLMKVATNQLIDVCKRYLNNAQLSTLPSPPSAILQAPPVSACGVKNSRRTMEDRHVALQDLHTLFNIKGYGTASYYAVFDGHNGSDAAVYSVSHLHQFLVESPYYPKDPITALQDAFLKTDDYFKEKCTEDGLNSGTTVVCCLLRPKERMLYIAWAGDSQAVLVRHGSAQQIVKPHKPDRPDERTRIEDMGGSVLYWGVWRVNGLISVSRAIGDQMCKPYIIPEPEIKAIPLDGTEDFIILACDGLWDKVDEDLAMITVYDYLQDSPGDLEGVSQRLVQLAKEESSTDNISVVVVFLSEPSEVVKRRPPMETASAPNPFLKQNGSELFCGGAQNGALRCFQDDEEEDFGPETDVDAVDDVLVQPSSMAAAKALVSSQDKELDDELERQRQQLSDSDDPVADADRSTPPARDVVGLPEAENVAESGGEGDDSDEEEWNYYKGEEKTNRSQTKEELDEDMESSQLNPEAPVFVPETPTFLVDKKLNDIDISSSPMKGSEKSLDNVPLPTQNDFHKGILECAGEFNRLNGVEVHRTELFDEKHKAMNYPGDESEILSTKAEFGDDSVISFSNSMNTSTAFSSGIPHDDENKSSSDMLFSNENDFDPSMDAPKELQDLVSSPEPDENLIPGTPHSTIAEASASPANMDTSPSQFADFEKSDELVNDEIHETKETGKSDSFFREENVFGLEQNFAVESPKPLTFAEVLKRPSPRTSPEPPVETSITEESKPLHETNPFAEQVKISLTEEPVINVEIEQTTVTCDLEETETINICSNHEIIENNETLNYNEDDKNKILDYPKQDIASNFEIDGNEEKNPFGNSIPSPFVTVRKSPVDESNVEFDQLKSPEDEKPPQFFQVDDNMQHFYSEEQKIDALTPLRDSEDEVKASSPQDALLTSLMHEKATENIQFMSINSEITESASDFDVISNNLPSNNDHVDVLPGDLQFGTVDSEFKFSNDFCFPAKETHLEKKESDAVLDCQELKVEENHFDLKSPAGVEKVHDFNESHFKEVQGDVFGVDITVNSFETNFESKFDAQDNVTLDSYSVESEVQSRIDNSVPHVNSSVNESNLFENSNVGNVVQSFDYHIPVSKDEFSFSKDVDVLHNDLQSETPQSDEIYHKLTDLNAVENKKFNEETSNFELPVDFASEKLAGTESVEAVTSESVIEQKTFEPFSSVPVKQQEETLEQTINVDFIPAEPLASPEMFLVSPAASKEKPVEQEQTTININSLADSEDIRIEEIAIEDRLILPPKEDLIFGETVEVKESAVSEVTCDMVIPPETSDSVEESLKGVSFISGTPPPTPAPSVVDEKSEQKEGLLVAAAAAAIAGAAATVGVAAIKTPPKKAGGTAPVPAKKTTPSAGPKKPTDLKTGIKASSPITKGSNSPRSATAAVPSKPASLPSTRKSLTSTVPAAKPASKPAVTAKTSTLTSKSLTAAKPSALTSKPSTPPSKPTTPTSSSRPSSATKTSPTKPNVSARSTVPAPSKPKPTSFDKKPLTNGDVSKTGGKKPDSTLASKKPLTSITATKTSNNAAKPLATKTSTTSAASKVGVSSVTKASPTTTAANKPKTTAALKSVVAANPGKTKLSAKPTDKTVKETVNKQISSSAPKTGGVKLAPSKTTALKKTDIKTLPPGRTVANKLPTVGKKTAPVAKKEIKNEELTQDHIVTTTNGYTEELIENGVELKKDSSPIENNVCDDTTAATN